MLGEVFLVLGKASFWYLDLLKLEVKTLHVYFYSHGQELFYKSVSNFTNKLVKQLLSMTVYYLKMIRYVRSYIMNPDCISGLYGSSWIGSSPRFLIVSDGLNYVRSSIFDCSKPKIGCSISNRWTCSSPFNVRKMMFESVQWII